MLRPSGTEPKLKYYFYALGQVEEDGDLDAAKATATLLLQRIAGDFTAQDER